MARPRRFSLDGPVTERRDRASSCYCPLRYLDSFGSSAHSILRLFHHGPSPPRFLSTGDCMSETSFPGACIQRMIFVWKNSSFFSVRKIRELRISSLEIYCTVSLSRGTISEPPSVVDSLCSPLGPWIFGFPLIRSSDEGNVMFIMNITHRPSHHGRLLGRRDARRDETG